MTQKSEWALYVGVFVMFILACWWYKGYCNLQTYKVAAFILFMVIGTRGICKTRQSWNMFLRKPKKMQSCPNHHEQNIQYSITITHSHFFYFQYLLLGDNSPYFRVYRNKKCLYDISSHTGTSVQYVIRMSYKGMTWPHEMHLLKNAWFGSANICTDVRKLKMHFLWKYWQCKL